MIPLRAQSGGVRSATVTPIFSCAPAGQWSHPSRSLPIMGPFAAGPLRSAIPMHLHDARNFVSCSSLVLTSSIPSPLRSHQARNWAALPTMKKVAVAHFSSRAMTPLGLAMIRELNVVFLSSSSNKREDGSAAPSDYRPARPTNPSPLGSPMIPHKPLLPQGCRSPLLTNAVFRSSKSRKN